MKCQQCNELLNLLFSSTSEYYDGRMKTFSQYNCSNSHYHEEIEIHEFEEDSDLAK